jgi:uncharacterized protein (TIGR02145 family)
MKIKQMKKIIIQKTTLIVAVYMLLFSIITEAQTLGSGVTDIDGNHYNSVIIGTQEWMKENLNVSRYTDGTIIPQVTDDATWMNLTKGAWCYFDYNQANGTTYGKLYNWYAVAGIYDAASLANPALRKQLAPNGYTIPTDTDWTILTDYLGGQWSSCGGKMKDTGTTHWGCNNVGATNSSGFSALGGGSGDAFLLTTIFVQFHYDTDWWSLTDTLSTFAFHRRVTACSPYQFRLYNNKKYGYYVRLLKNSALNIQSLNNNSFNIYPNPAKEQLIIDCIYNSKAIGYSYKIVNTLGQEVLYGVLNSSPQNIIQLNNIKSQGLYFVEIYNTSNTLIATKKIIIQQ